MKKTLIGLFLILGAASFADAGKIEAKGALDLGGKYHYGKNYRNQKSKNSSGEVGVEYRNEVAPGLEVGGGTAFQFHGTAKYKFDTQTAVKPYVKGDLGYSFNNGDHDYGRLGKFKAKNGLYYGVGGGVNYNNFNVELMYKENQGDYEYEGPLGAKSKYDANYRRVSLGVGYDFNLSQ